MFEQMLNGLVRSATGSAFGAGYGLRRRRRRVSDQGGSAIARAAASPQGLAVITALAMAAYKKFTHSPGGQPQPQPQHAPPDTPPHLHRPPPADWTQPHRPVVAPLPGAAAPPTLPPGAMPPAAVPPGAWSFGGAPAVSPHLPETWAWSFGSPNPDPPVAAAPQAAAHAAEIQSRFLVLCMIAAAQSDGAIDGMEQTAILGEVDKSTDPATRQALAGLLNHTVGLSTLAAAVTSQQQAMEGYLAALLAIGDPSPAEAVFLQQMATAFRLDPATVATLREELGR